MKHRWSKIVGAALFVGTALSPISVAQPTPAPQPTGPYARIAIMRAINESHAVDFEAGYVRHLDWHRKARDPFAWYGYSVWASTEHQRRIIYATFGHTAAELSNPISPVEDEQDVKINLLPHVEFMGNWIYEFLPALSRGNGVPTVTLRAEYTTVEVNYGAGRAFEAAIAAEQSKLQGETLWYRLVAGGNLPRYVRIRPRPSLRTILDDRAEQALPERVNGLVAKVTIEVLVLKPNMLVNVTPEPAP
ncbi:MAG TPA: hypothetical protein VKW06_11720 [Candidatus Angelobacter sp.]|nr:hypothetical protein [Candidatus Angelobacter sp.]